MRSRPSPAPEVKTPPKVIPIQPAPVADEDRGTGTDYAAVTERYLQRIKNPITAIRGRCIQCCNGQISEVKLCPATTCALHNFRMGENLFNLKTRRKNAREEGISLQEYDEQNGITPKDGDYDEAKE